MRYAPELHADDSVGEPEEEIKELPALPLAGHHCEGHFEDDVPPSLDQVLVEQPVGHLDHCHHHFYLFVLHVALLEGQLFDVVDEDGVDDVGGDLRVLLLVLDVVGIFVLLEGRQQFFPHEQAL